MDALLALALLHVIPGENQQQNVNRPAGFALIECARLGMPPESIKKVFGSPEASGGGRLDWRTNRDRYLFWDYTRYGVWIEWEAGPIPRTGRGPGIVRVHGGIGP